ncbi:MAG TPA: SbcC/MukB-like Walker B domain-containing protein, partial [Salinivirga sp.]|uniref:SbcC/MukB-like Walker B domain-containing protein n=1 Tax=Salinivirga sp. TaxID=1970192 RepID=UPI002B467D05
DKQKEIQQLMQDDNFTSIAQVQGILQQPMDVELNRKKIEDYKKELHARETSLNNLLEEMGDQKFDAEHYKALEKKVKEQQRHISEMESERGALQSNLKVLNEKLTQKEKLQKELDAQSKRKANFEVLHKMLYGDKFVRYVSQIYLEQLCAIANERFRKLTHNQLELDIDDKYNFIVRDFLHNGHTRLLKTLSGGQTFQAALSLAMALSEQIQQYHKVKQQFFFMDEGFGSLDRESLSLVFDTLKQLRKEQRIVGIISHVEELQTEIDRFLMVENDPEEGSSVVFNG